MSINFGRYDIHFTGRKEAIEWIIINETKEYYDLITKNVIETAIIDKEDKDWEECSLRKTFIPEFIKTAFRPTERKLLLEVEHVVSSNPLLKGEEKSKCIDSIFIPSIEEIKDLIGENGFIYGNRLIFERGNGRVKPTIYANQTKQGRLVTNLEGYCWYWLRDQGINQNKKARVNANGEIDLLGLDNNDTRVGLRLMCRMKKENKAKNKK